MFIIKCLDYTSACGTVEKCDQIMAIIMACHGLWGHLSNSGHSMMDRS